MYSSRSWGADGLPPTSNRFLSEAREDKDTSSTLYTYTCIYIHWNEHNATASGAHTHGEWVCFATTICEPPMCTRSPQQQQQQQ